jgi:hypothetical protein
MHPAEGASLAADLRGRHPRHQRVQHLPEQREGESDQENRQREGDRHQRRFGECANHAQHANTLHPPLIRIDVRHGLASRKERAVSAASNKPA